MGNRETITYEMEWRIDNLSELVMHVEGITGEHHGSGSKTGESASEILRAGMQTADGAYKFDLGEFTPD